MGKDSAQLAVAGEIERAKALCVLSVLFTVVGGVVCVVCFAHMGRVVGLGPPAAPPPLPPPLKLSLGEMAWWAIGGY